MRMSKPRAIVLAPAAVPRPWGWRTTPRSSMDRRAPSPAPWNTVSDSSGRWRARRPPPSSIAARSTVNSIASPAPLLPEILALHGKWRAGKEALVCGDQRLTWGAFIRRCNQVANGLLALGLGRGDRVVVLMCNSPEMVEVLFGIMTAGCVSVPLNLAVDDRALAAMIDDCAPGAVICSADQLSRLQHRSGDG